MRMGQRVVHPTFGEGTVIAFRRDGGRLIVRVDFGYTQPWFAVDVLREIDSAATTSARTETSTIEAAGAVAAPSGGARRPTTDKPKRQAAAGPTARRERPPSGPQPLALEHTTPPPLPPTASPSRNRRPAMGPSTEARQGIVALRLGQILESHALQLSVGTGGIQRSLTDALGRVRGGAPTCLLVEGAWGGGKTHVLTLLQVLARSEDMAVSTAVMDGVGVSLANPMQLMEELLNSLRFPSTTFASGMGQIIREAKMKDLAAELRRRGAHKVAGALEAFPSGAFDDPEGLQHIEDFFCSSISASDIRRLLRRLNYPAITPPSFRAHRLSDRPRAFIASLEEWAKFAVVMGAQGLAVVLDELDVEYAATARLDHASLKRQAMRMEVLREIKKLHDRRAQLLVAFASAPASGDVNPVNDAVQDVLETLGPALTCHLKVVEPSDSDLQDLLTELAHLYSSAYPATALGLSPSGLAAVLKGLTKRYRSVPNPVPRHFVRTAIETFDLLTAGAKPLEEVLRLLEAPGA